MTDADERVQCWALGIRLQENVQFLLRSTQLMADEVEASDSNSSIYRGIVDAQVRNIDRNLRDAESCDVGVNGYISGQFSEVQDVVKGAPSRKVFEVVRKFSLELHQAAVNELTRNTG